MPAKYCNYEAMAYIFPWQHYADSLRESSTETHQAPDKHRLNPEVHGTVTQNYLITTICFAAVNAGVVSR